MPDTTIEKSVPLPKARRDGLYPWAQMEVGDSFPVARYARKGDSPQVTALRVREAANKYASYHPGYRFSVRRDAEGEYRCWRVRYNR